MMPHFEPAAMFVNAGSVEQFVEDLDALATAWLSLANVLRSFPTGWFNGDNTEQAKALETTAEQLTAIVKRFRENEYGSF